MDLETMALGGKSRLAATQRLQMDQTMKKHTQPLPRVQPRVAVARAAAMIAATIAASSALAETTMLAVGKFAAEGTPCEQAAVADVLFSTGHAVSPAGKSCRVVSRTSTGKYYPLLNEMCGGDQAPSAMLSVKNSRRITFQLSGEARRSYRFCPGRNQVAKAD